MDNGTIQVWKNIDFISLISLDFSEYVNKYLSQTKKLEPDWVLTILPVSQFECDFELEKNF